MPPLTAVISLTALITLLSLINNDEANNGIALAYHLLFDNTSCKFLIKSFLSKRRTYKENFHKTRMGLVLKKILFFCCAALPILMAKAEPFSLCTKLKNITFIPYIDIHDAHKAKPLLEDDFKDSAMQLKYFIGSLLETSCFEVWFYSPIQNRCIQQTEENYIPFLETEWMAVTSTDDNDILNLLSDIPSSNDEIEQSLFFINFFINYNRDEMLDNQQDLVIAKLKDSRNNFNIVLLCIGPSSPICVRGAKWLPKQNIVYRSFTGERKFNPNLHRILFDLANNPQYDWHERYNNGGKSSMPIFQGNRNTYIYLGFNSFWNYREISTFFFPCRFYVSPIFEDTSILSLWLCH